jgi:ABC-type glycerol-3-phosphate transport system substrate-binding protein
VITSRTLGRRSALRLFVLGGAAVLTAACAGAAPANTPVPAAAPATPAPAGAPATAATAAPAVTAVPAKAGMATLQYWSFFPSDNSRWSERPTMLGEFTTKTGIGVEVNFVQDAVIDTKVQTGFAAKQLPDLVDPGVTQYSIGWGRQGIIIDVNDLIGKLGRDDFAQPLVNALTYKGKLYGIPWMANPQLMFYRKDWLADKGLKITSWDEWVTVAKTFTGKNPAGKDGYGQGGYMAPVHQAQWTQDWLGPNGGRTFDQNWKVVLDTFKPNVEAFTTMKSLSAFFQPGASTNNYGDTNNLFTDEVIAIALSSTTFVNGVIKTKPALVDKVGVQQIPQGPSGKGDRGAFLGCYSFVICSTSQHTDDARTFLTWLFDPAVYIRVFKTIDFGHVPTRISVATDSNLATIVPPLAITDIQAGIKAAQIATLTGEDNGPNPLSRQISAANIWTTMSQQILTGPVDVAMKTAADEIRKIVADDPADLG